MKSRACLASIRREGAASLWEVALLTVDPVLGRYPGPVRLI